MESTEGDVAWQEQTNWRAPPLQHMEDHRSMIVGIKRSLGTFLTSGILALGPDLYMPFDAFWSAYKTFCKEYNLAPPNASAARLDNIMYKLGLSFIRDGRALMYPRNGNGWIRKTTWVLGADFAAKP